MLLWPSIARVWLASLSLLTLIAAADPDTTVFPTCAQQCVEQALQTLPCSPEDMACMCQDPELQRFMNGCMPTACTARESLVAMNLTSIQCGAPIRSRQSVISTTALVGGAVALLCIGVRLCAKPRRDGLRRFPELLDDWTMLLNGVLIIPFTVVAVLMDRYGMGQDIWKLSFENIRLTFIFMYMHQILYMVVNTITKISIVFLYLRIFPGEVLPAFHPILWGTMAFVVAFGISFALTIAFQCAPANRIWESWDEPMQGHCVNMNAVAFANGGIILALDIWLLLLPLPELWKLSMPLKQKLGVFSVFAVGIFVTVVTIPRILSISEFAETMNPTWDFVYVTFWVIVEADVGVICACLPRAYVCIRRLYREKYPRASTAGSTSISGYGSRTIRRHKSIPLGGGSDIQLAASSHAVPESVTSASSSKHKLFAEVQTVELGRMSKSDSAPSVQRSAEDERG